MAVATAWINVDVWTDGASRGNPGPGAMGIVVRSHGKKRVLLAAASRVFPLEECASSSEDCAEFVTNNIAEYDAINTAIGACRARGTKTMQIYSDSLLAVKQIEGAWRCKDPTLRRFLATVLDNRCALDGFSISHIRRGENREADFLANAILDEAQKEHNEVMQIWIEGEDIRYEHGDLSRFKSMVEEHLKLCREENK